MNILIIRFSSLGDLVTLEPTFRAIRYFYNHAHISFVTTNIGKALYDDSNYFDEYIINKSIKDIRTKKFDLVLNLQCNKPSHYIALLSKHNRIINKSFNLLQKIFKVKTKTKNLVEILTLCGIDRTDAIQYVQNNSYIQLPTKEIIDFKNQINKKFGDKKIIAISTGASERWKSKLWGIENYKILIKNLLQNYGIILVGSSLEKKDEEILLKYFTKNEIISFVNKTNISELKSLLKYTNLYIGNDSGPSHLAAGVGISTITIFGPTDIKHCVKFEKYKGHHTCIKPSKEITCHPCYKSICPTNHECMKNIGYKTILESIKQLGV